MTTELYNEYRKSDYEFFTDFLTNKITELEETINKLREQLALRYSLEDKIEEIIIPMEEEIEIKDGKQKTSIKKVFPGYVLIKMIMETLISFNLILLPLVKMWFYNLKIFSPGLIVNATPLIFNVYA